MALSAFCPVTATLRSPMGGCWALPGPLLSAIGTGHRAIAPRAPLLPLSVHWGTNHNPTSMSQVKGKKEGRQKWEEIFRSLFSLRLDANKISGKQKMTWLPAGFLICFFPPLQARISQNNSKVKSRTKHKKGKVITIRCILKVSKAQTAGTIFSSLGRGMASGVEWFSLNLSPELS